MLLDYKDMQSSEQMIKTLKESPLGYLLLNSSKALCAMELYGCSDKTKTDVAIYLNHEYITYTLYPVHYARENSDAGIERSREESMSAIYKRWIRLDNSLKGEPIHGDKFRSYLIDAGFFRAEYVIILNTEED